MSKIAKFIKSALNNSSANEAAQALKMAAATMQKEGINPADLLQEKGANTDDSAVIALKATVDRLQRELEASKHTSNTVNAKELREAKELAIKWHRIAQQQEAHLKDLAPIAVKAQEEVKELTEDKRILKNYVRLLGVGGVLAVIFVSGFFINASHENYDKGYNAGKFAGIVQTQQEEREKARNFSAEPVNQVIDTQPAPIDTGKATCWIQGKFTTKNGKPIKPTSVKFWYDNGIVTSFENNKNVGEEKADYDRNSFVNQVNKAFPGKTDCKLGVIK
ncbi:hypothetical protein P8G24_004703 [Salmonella enterica]|nr:hypothetical protein [Salmonella enterica]